MKEPFLIMVFLFSFLVLPFTIMAQRIDNHTAREEAKGKEVWEKLQSKKLECKALTDNNFEVLGEYFMGKMAGSSHETMNNMMIRMMGEKGERQMHISLGKQQSGCETSKGGSWSMMGNFYGNNMMGNAWGLFGWFTWLLIVIFLILGIVYFWKGISRPDRK